jgi:hypothetical protein
LRASSHHIRYEDETDGYISICIYYLDHSLDSWYHDTPDSDREALGGTPTVHARTKTIDQVKCWHIAEDRSEQPSYAYWGWWAVTVS